MPTRSGRTYSTKNPTTSTIPCPVPGCNDHLFTGKPALIQHHLRHSHSQSERSSIPTTFFREAGVEKCTLCPPHNLSLFSSHTRLATHVRNKHNVSMRTASNLDLLLAQLPPLPHQSEVVKAQWTKSLLYLHKLDIIPFSFRKSIYHKLDNNTKSLLKNLAYKVFYATSLSFAPHENARNLHIPPSLTLSSPMWKLSLLFEGTIMAPPSPTEPSRNYQKLIKHRLALFHEGRFMALHRNALSIIPKPSYEPMPAETRAKQLHTAANNDNW